MFHSISVIINSASGSTSDISEDICRKFEAANMPKPVIYDCAPEALDDAFQRVADDDTDLLIIYGGDGTCKAGAICAREKSIPLIALPGGTMNMLPKALYGTTDWQEALDLALGQDAPRWIAAGQVNDQIFFVAMIIGEPIKMSDLREELRDGHVIEAMKHVPQVIGAVTSGEIFDYTVDGAPYVRDANALLLSCPLMSTGARKPDCFELATIPPLSLRSVIGVGVKTLLTNWRDSAHVRVGDIERLNITGKGAFDILLDGEAHSVNAPIEVSLLPQGVQVLAPNLNLTEAA